LDKHRLSTLKLLSWFYICNFCVLNEFSNFKWLPSRWGWFKVINVCFLNISKHFIYLRFYLFSFFHGYSLFYI
jgi:hypothetical protein